jgi:hypothetical protein
MTRKQRSQRETQAARVGIARAALFGSWFAVRGWLLQCSATLTAKLPTALKPEPLNPLVRGGLEFLKVRVTLTQTTFNFRGGKQRPPGRPTLQELGARI